ncbi:MAG: hypothetical protein ACL93V_16715 [Candidatus Electrothrix sp. YB6]
MLCLFAGEFEKISVQQPPETLHFGLKQRVNDDGASNYFVRVGGKEFDIHWRNGEKRVVDINKLTNDFKEEKSGGKDVTSAEFARNMVTGAQKVEFVRSV